MNPIDPADPGSVPALHTRDAGPGEMAAVLRAIHAVRSEGMAPDDHLSYRRALQESPWGREHGRFILGIAAGGTIVAAVELYSLEGRLHGRAVRIAGVGELFALPQHRGRGFAAALLAAVLRRTRRDRPALALHWSRFGAADDAWPGFTPLPAGEASCVTTLPAPWPREPAWVGRADPPRGVPKLRTGGPADIEALLRLHDEYDSGAAFRLTRDRPAWEQLFLKMAAGRRLRGDAETVIWVIDDDAGPAAYAVVQDRPGALRWLEHGARQGCGRRVDDLFWAAIARARRQGAARLEGWMLPSAAAGETLYPIARRPRQRSLPMARALDPDISLSGLRNGADCRVGELDRF